MFFRPHELMIATTTEANTMQLLNLSRISHKYQFRSIETWAISALTMFYIRPGALDDIPSTDPDPLPLTHVTTAPPAFPTPSLVQLTEIATLCERVDLLDAAVARWKRLIGEGKDLALAISLGERFNLRSVLGIAYHAMMLKGKTPWESDPLLTRDQRIRLLCGYYACGKLHDTLPSQPPVLTHSSRCPSNVRCTKAWGMLWKAAFETGPQVLPGIERENILGRTMLAESMIKAIVEKEIPSQGYLDNMPYCRENALLATTMKMREIRDMLPDLFMDDF